MKKRKLNRLQGYDYSRDGYYFVTVCTYNRFEWFGKIENKEMQSNKYAGVIWACWHDLPNHYQNVRLDEFVVMPNHIHGIIIIDNVGNGFKPFPTIGRSVNAPKNHGLSEIMRGFKTFSSRKINEMTINDGKFRWQKSFHDRIIRGEQSLDRIRAYIHNNPLQWPDDAENPAGNNRGRSLQLGDL